MTKPNVLIVHDQPGDFDDLLVARFPNLRIDCAATPDEVIPALEACQPEAVFSIKQPSFPQETHRPITRCPSVRWIHVGGSGFDHLLPWEGGNTVLTNCAGVLAQFLAESVTCSMLMLNGGFPRYANQQRARVWKQNPFTPMVGQTLLIVGVGHIGAHVAANAKALGMRVIGVRGTGAADPSVDQMHRPDALPSLLPQADFVSLHVRLGAETTGLIDANALSAMKPGAFLINTARGPVVDQPAMIDALKSGQLGGAYLDVFEVEPLPEDNPLWHLENVILTPHAADCLPDWPRRFAELFADNLDRYIAGQPLTHQVQMS
jgi:phosphoglycerate dehydrogenase-like enzyme